MTQETPPEDLLKRVAGQDVAALSELYDRFAPRVYGLIVRILPSHEAAEEVLREVFLGLWRESQPLSQAGGSVAAWLVVSARAAAVDRLRQNSEIAPIANPQVNKSKTEHGPNIVAKKPRSGAAKLRERLPASAKSPAAEGAGKSAARAFPPAWLPQPKEIALVDDRLVLLHKAIKQLPEPQRQALELAVFGGRSESEIAIEMGEPLGKAQRSLRAALTFIKHRRRAVCGTWAANI